ncbi:hypothetical protein Tco_0493786 [Tanacetum coccineum]
MFYDRIFDKFTYKKGESLHEYYLRFTLLLNDMNIYKMPLEQFQVNTKFLNTLPDEWSKFVTDVKLVKDLHTTNVDQLHAHLEQHLTTNAKEEQVEANSENKDIIATTAKGKVTCPDSAPNQREKGMIHELNSAKVALMASLSHYGLDALAEVHNHDNMNNNVAHQAVQVMPSSQQSNVVNHSETEITSDSNIIPYSQYVIESQQVTVQNSNSSTQQDDLILSVIEQLKTQVANCTKTNLENKSVNNTLIAELERYKDQVNVLKEGQNVNLRRKSRKFIGKNISEFTNNRKIFNIRTLQRCVHNRSQKTLAPMRNQGTCLHSRDELNGIKS